ncbi:inactive pancreatic lipase-related protein 1-like [Notamacropus eugenii]|uniref:inactive pancreatic lipase-related protein 1-like n=1 Tax=Notamacropus eugenii TaxID=9315 RepID=UPI003B66FD9A
MAAAPTAGVKGGYDSGSSSFGSSQSRDSKEYGQMVRKRIQVTLAWHWLQLVLIGNFFAHMQFWVAVSLWKEVLGVNHKGVGALVTVPRQRRALVLVTQGEQETLSLFQGQQVQYHLSLQGIRGLSWILGLWTLTLLLLGTVRGKEVCYGDLGCFPDDDPWGGTLIRPLKVLPWSPETINIRFLLYTNENPYSFQILQPSEPSTVEHSNFKTDRKTRFIIHGYIDKGEESWLLDMCKNMFQVEQVNCICVDWKRGSQTTYTQAANNIRVVGAEVANMIKVLSTSYQYLPSNVHIIGHSLGAHAAGEAGRRTPGLGRITGLDPAESSFEGAPEEVRLDSSDALFVDVIHTDSAPLIPNLGFGTTQSVGHLDFFPNGGKEMPGCKKNFLSQIVDIDGIWSGTRDFVACNHLRSYKYYSDSILNPDGFTAFPCASYKTFREEKCFPCPSEGCPQMGHYADKYPGKTSQKQQKFFLNTGDTSNFSRWRYKVSVTLSGRTATGQIKVALYGSNGNTRQYDIFKGVLIKQSTHSSEIDVQVNVGKLEKVKFLWNNNMINPTFPKVGASKVIVQTEDGTVYNFCSEETVKEDTYLTLTPC